MRILIITFFLLLHASSWGQRKNALEVMSTSPTSKVSLLTCGPGDEAVTVYGHTAIRIYDEAYGQDLVFNYGTYNFNTPGFYPKFIKGQLLYTLSASTFKNFLRNYEYENRYVVENEFQLDSLTKQAFIEAINVNYQPENRSYKYDFFFDNCSSRVWEVLKTVNKDFRLAAVEIEALTFRDMINQYQQGMPWTDFGINIIIGSPADRAANAAEQLFLPDYLQASLKRVKLKDELILGPDQWLFKANRDDTQGAPIYWPALVLLLFLFLELYLFFKKKDDKFTKVYDQVYFLLIGLLGALLSFMWLGTDHLATHRNFNLLWMNPLYLFFPLPGMIPAKKYFSFFLLVLLAIAVLGVLHILPQILPLTALLIIAISALKLTRKYI